MNLLNVRIDSLRRRLAFWMLVLLVAPLRAQAMRPLCSRQSAPFAMALTAAVDTPVGKSMELRDLAPRKSRSKPMSS